MSAKSDCEIKLYDRLIRPVPDSGAGFFYKEVFILLFTFHFLLPISRLATNFPKLALTVLRVKKTTVSVSLIKLILLGLYEIG